MTIAIGVLCPGGAALVTDSLTRLPGEDGLTQGFIHPRPPKVDEEAGVAWIHSGTEWVNDAGAPILDSNAAFREERADLENATFIDLSRLLYVVHDLISLGVPRAVRRQALDGSAPSAQELRRINIQELVVASIPAGKMAFLTDDGEQWFEGHGVVVAGAPTLWAKEKRFERWPGPTTLEGALKFALTIAAAYLDHVYGTRTLADFAAEGLIPPAAYPLNLTAISTTGELQTWTLP